MTYLNKYLFIGGAADGEWIATEPGYKGPVVIPVPIKVDLTHRSEEELFNLKTETHVYYSEYFRAGELTILFFRFDELSLEEAVAKLFQGYKP